MHGSVSVPDMPAQAVQRKGHGAVGMQSGRAAVWRSLILRQRLPCTKRTPWRASEQPSRAASIGATMARRKKIYEGKAKTLFEGPEPGTIVQYFKDDATAFNAQKKDVIDGKGVLNNMLSEYFMTGLTSVGIPNHFLKRLNMREQLVRAVEIVPLEVIVRNYAAGSMAQRLGIDEGTQLPRPIVEYCLKDDALGDPLVTEEHIAAFGWASQQDMDDILSLALRVNDFLSGVMYGVGIKLVDFKIEIGRVYEGDFMRLIVADEISPDSCRLWDIETGQKLDKDVFRRDLGSLTDAYTEVAKRLGVMPKGATQMNRPTLIN
jgi:phosphoribosylaminoimidazole-succinocarboxamide synthase